MKTFAYSKSTKRFYTLIVVLENGSEYSFLFYENFNKKKFKKKISKKFGKIKKIYIIGSYI